MFSALWNRNNSGSNAEEKALIAAVNGSQAVIWFAIDGTILDANQNFLRCVGYDLDEIKGKHHRILMPPEAVDSADYRAFWEKLRAGKTMSETIERRAKGGRQLWLEASYIPVRDASGKPVKVVKLATDVTAARTLALATDLRMRTIAQVQAVVEINPDGSISSVNDNFLQLIGRERAALIGKPYSMLVDPSEAAGPEHARFWAALMQGTAQTGEYRRRSGTGKDLWLQTTYAPLRDALGRISQIIAFSSDITDTKRRTADAQAQIASISRSQAVIEFALDGTILTANDNFLAVMGYRLDEIVGRHHSLFIAPGEAQSPEYAQFWQSLRNGDFHTSEFQRLGKNDKVVFIQATYAPVLDPAGKPIKVVKFATDVTAAKLAVSLIGTALDRLAEGDLSMGIPQPLTGDFEKIRSNFNNSIKTLARVLQDVLTRASTIRRETMAISSAAGDLSVRTEQQAATLEETAAAIDVLSRSLATAAQQATDTAGIVATAKLNAEQGGEVVRGAVSAMSGIAESSSKISRITTVIDEIAFQTNLLALNAGVEAARAGDAGRGFAVVASEVRALAQRSSDAAREIAELLSASSQQVSLGVSLVDQTGAALTGIESSIATMHTHISALAASSRQQSNDLKGINASVSQLDQVTQRNAASFEETAAVTKTLLNEVDQLVQSSARFRLSEAERGAAPRSSSSDAGGATFRRAG